MMRLRFVVLAMVFVLGARFSAAQVAGRLSDHDLERLMQNLKDEAKPFKNSFGRAEEEHDSEDSREEEARALGRRLPGRQNARSMSSSASIRPRTR